MCASINNRHVYVVHKGTTPGIYASWDEARKHVDGFRGAVYKKFDAKTQLVAAQHFLKYGPDPVPGLKESQDDNKPDDKLGKTLEWISPQCPRYASPTEIEPLVVFCDGSSQYLRDFAEATEQMKKSTRRVGGYGIHFLKEDNNIRGAFPLENPTNNRCELYACIKALMLLKEQPSLYGWRAAENQLIMINTDSTYTIKTLASYTARPFSNWANKSLLERLSIFASTMPVMFCYVPGHSGVKGNENADQAAKEGAQQHMQQELSAETTTTSKN